MTAQLLAWPRLGACSLSDFSESMLELIECIDAVHTSVQRGMIYPEETCLFVDMQLTHSVVLAAGFCLRAVSELWFPNEATSYVTDRLVQLTEYRSHG